MLNINSLEKGSMKKESITAAQSIFDEILSLTNNAVICLKENDLSRLIEILKKREQKIKRLTKIREEINLKGKQKMSVPEKEEINKLIRLKIENIAKVDEKSFDIIKCQKSKIARKINEANKGLNFLKSYKQQVNSNKTFYRTI